MNYFEFKRRADEGSFAFDSRGHNINIDGTFDVPDWRMQRALKSILEMSDYSWETRNDPRWESLKEHTERIAYDDNWAQPGKPIGGFGLSGGEYECQHCGQRLLLGLQDEFTITLYRQIIHKDIERTVELKNGVPFGIRRISKRLSRKCKFHRGLKPPVNKVNIPTGKLLIANHFGEFEEVPKEERYSEKWSLNHTIGRNNREKHLAESNIMYGQLGNTSFDVFVNEDRTHIKLLPSWKLESLEDAVEYEPEDQEAKDNLSKLQVELEGFKSEGEVSCAVWAWFGADMSMLPKSYDHTKTDNKCILEVTPGTWQFQTNYHHLPESVTSIYAELKLV